jgi:hypothetical protein
MHDYVQGSIKDLITGNPIRNTEFKVVHKTYHYSDAYRCSTDNEGNYYYKATFRKDVTHEEFTIKNCFYNSKPTSNLEQFYDFYIHEGQLFSQNKLILNFNINTTPNDTLVLTLGLNYNYYPEVKKIYVGPFPSKLNINLLDTVENISSYKKDGIIERNLNWKFRNKSGNITLKDNYITGIGTTDSMSF